MALLLDDLKAYLVAQSVALTGAIFLGSLPATPDVCLSLIEYGGREPEAGFGVSGVAREWPRVQVVARGVANDYAGPRTLAEAAYKALAKVNTQTLTATYYYTVWPLQAPFLLQRDTNNRVQIAFNVECQKALS